MYAAICEGKVTFSTMGQPLHIFFPTFLTPSKWQSFHIQTQCFVLLTLNLSHEDLQVRCFSKSTKQTFFGWTSNYYSWTHAPLFRVQSRQAKPDLGAVCLKLAPPKNYLYQNGCAGAPHLLRTCKPRSDNCIPSSDPKTLTRAILPEISIDWSEKNGQNNKIHSSSTSNFNCPHFPESRAGEWWLSC